MAQIKTIEIKGDEREDNVRLTMDRSALGGAVGGDVLSRLLVPLSDTQTALFIGHNLLGGTPIEVEETEGDENVDRIDLPFLKDDVDDAAAFGTVSEGLPFGSGATAGMVVFLTNTPPTP